MPAEKQFNTAGPCIAEDHYLIDPLERIDYRNLLALIDSKRYFVLHAPRQTGKTTSLRALVDLLNRENRYRAVYANIETAQAARHDVVAGMNTVASVLVRQIGFNTGEVNRGLA